MKEVILILAEAGLELVPKEICNHPSVVNNAKRRGKKPQEVLLDVSIHYPAMKKLPFREKRGRPDITHISLLLALDSILNKKGMLSVYVHTFNDFVIIVDKKTRIPRNYNRFVGLIEQLFKKGKVPPSNNKPLLELRKQTLKDLLRELSPYPIVLFDEGGVREKIKDFINRIISYPRPAFIIGAFQSGSWKTNIKEYANYIISIYEGRLSTWTVLSTLIHCIEDLHGLI